MRGCAKLFPERTTAEWLPILEVADIPSGPVHSYDTLFGDDEIVANDSFMVYEHPVAGKIRTVTPGPALQRRRRQKLFSACRRS